MKNELVKKFLALFDGYELAYGQHGDFKESDSGKVSGRAQTIGHALTEEIVLKHLEGTGNSLGIVPLKKNNKLRFGAIDIDIKHPTNPLIHKIEEIEDKINKLGLPLVACQSKSKGVHLYCFTKEEVDSRLMIDKLKEWAAILGYGNCEIFPKQTNRADSKDVGNWINMPYFNNTNTLRYAINKGKKLNIDEFFTFAEVMRISKEELEDFEIDNLDESYDDAPPCLQMLASIGVSEGSRNNGLYDFAVYFRNKFPDNYEEKIMEINTKLFSPMLNLKEVEGVLKAVRKKEFFFRCNEYPIVQYCNKTECKKRRYGIGCSQSASTDINFENLTKYISSDNTVRWYMEYSGQRIQMTTEELLNQKLLVKKMLDSFNIIFVPMKPQLWNEKLVNLLGSCVVYYDPPDASSKGQFKELLDTFLTESVPGHKKSDLLKYNTFLDEKHNEIYFKSSLLFEYLKNKRFSYDEQEIWHWLKEFNGRAEQLSISNKKIRTWVLPAPEFYKEKDEEKI